MERKTNTFFTIFATLVVCMMATGVLIKEKFVSKKSLLTTQYVVIDGNVYTVTPKKD